MKEALTEAIRQERAELGVQRTERPGWTMHDFRRSGVTALAGMGFPPHVCDRPLNHVTGTINGVAAVYQRAEFVLERKASLDAWSEFVLKAAGGRQGDTNVIGLRAART